MTCRRHLFTTVGNHARCVRCGKSQPVERFLTEEFRKVKRRTEYARRIR